MRWLPLLLIPLACASAETPSRAAPQPGPATVEPVAPEPVAPEQPEPVAPEPVEPEPAVPLCDSTAVAAARTALAVAPAHEVDARHLADCRPEQITCADEREPLAATDTCQLVGYHGDARWEIVVIPRPATGAPTRIEIWVDEAGKEAGNVRIEGSTWGVVDGVRIQGQGLYKSHTHGGAAAHIGGARFEVQNLRDEPVELTLTGTRWLVAYLCELPREERARPKPGGLAVEPDLVDGRMKVEIPARTTKTVVLAHAGQSAYMASCDRFATAALFEIDRARVEVIAEHRVVRREPLRGR